MYVLRIKLSMDDETFTWKFDTLDELQQFIQDSRNGELGLLSFEVHSEDARQRFALQPKGHNESGRTLYEVAIV